MEYFKLKKTKKISTKEISFLIGLIIAILASFFNCFAKCDEISKNVLRLHILANSNSEKDQKLKIKVRDSILKNFNFNKNNDIEETKKQVEKNLPEIEKVAKKTIENEGFSYSVTANLKKTYFTTREYENFSMPAGFYDAITIEIGKAKGKNWWCVMVPSLCVPAANKKEEALETFNSDEKDLIKKGKKTEVRFAIFELFQNFLN